MKRKQSVSRLVEQPQHFRDKRQPCMRMLMGSTNTERLARCQQGKTGQQPLHIFIHDHLCMSLL